MHLHLYKYYILSSKITHNNNKNIQSKWKLNKDVTIQPTRFQDPWRTKTSIVLAGFLTKILKVSMVLCYCSNHHPEIEENMIVELWHFRQIDGSNVRI
jgi:hypothetical protein